MRSLFSAYLYLLAKGACALSVSVEGAALDSAPELSLRSVSGSVQIGLGITNPGDTPEQIAFAQIAITSAPTAGSDGQLVISPRDALASFFGTPAMDISIDPSIVTLQAGGFPPGSLPAGVNGQFALLDITAPAGVSGVFEIVALPLNPLGPLSSSHWSAPGVPPLLVPYENPARADNTILLATVLVVPEPGCLGTLMTYLIAACCRGVRRFS